MGPNRILFIESHAGFRNLALTHLRAHGFSEAAGYSFVEEHEIESGFNVLQKDPRFAGVITAGSNRYDPGQNATFDGLELVKRMRQSSKLRHIPAVIYTLDPGYIEKASKFSTTGVVLKTADRSLESLASTLKRLIEMSQ